MDAVGGSVAQAPARAGRWRTLAMRALVALASTVLVVQLVVVSAAGLLWAASMLLGFPGWLVIALAAFSAAVSLWLGLVIFARAWTVEGRLSRGEPADDPPSPPAP